MFNTINTTLEFRKQNIVIKAGTGNGVLFLLDCTPLCERSCTVYVLQPALTCIHALARVYSGWHNIYLLIASYLIHIRTYFDYLKETTRK